MSTLNTNFNIETFFNCLSDMNCISPVWKQLLETLKDLEPGVSDQALALFCIYFSQLDDGNICIPLDEQALITKWNKKWQGLLLLKDNHSRQKEKNLEPETPDFAAIIKAGLKDLTASKLKNLITDDTRTEAFSKPFVIADNWLFATKYFKAKLSIEKNIKLIMTSKASPVSETAEDIQKYFADLTDHKILLEEEQAAAICRGLENNLIITGGPGTGKTTVICYLLWKLFFNQEYLNYPLYLAAPSGKAADRMKESISSNLEKLNLNNLNAQEKQTADNIFLKLNNTQSSTIHRLLSFNPRTNSFKYNAQNQFEANSIFVIDEASMIDITLFSSLLEAIPQTARVFILGDKDQLPSVQAGAVLGELLAKKEDSVAKLVKSKRFNEKSDAGLLKNALQEESPLDKTLLHSTDWDSWKEKSQFSNIPDKTYPVITFTPSADYKERTEELENIIDYWSAAFYKPLYEQAKNIDVDSPAEELNALWKNAIKARILCAERQGPQGVESINHQICSSITKEYNLNSSEEYYTGQLLMLTKNQNLFSLFNGDSGIVIQHNKLKYLMVKKELEDGKSALGAWQGKATNERSLEQQGILNNGSYIFYPLHLLPKESLETAYTITIHKSQGSGYKAILVMLPSQAGHPLLNRQIAYTAITRTEGSTYIYASYETMENARKTIIERDTQISL